MPQLQGAVMRLAAVVALSTTAAVDGMAGTFKGTVSPPRGFNNYCTHQGLADEQWQLGQATHLAAQLLASGYDTFVLDGGWSASVGPEVNGSRNSTQYLDGFGRPVPSIAYPSARASGGAPTLKPFVDRVHALGLKVGVWHIRGAHANAVKQRLPVKGTNYTVDQIVRQKPDGPPQPHWQQECLWDTEWVGVNASHPGAGPYYTSIAELFVGEWGVDFVKFDCSYIDAPMLHGRASMEEIDLFYAAMASQRTHTGAPPVLSLSPGGVREDQTRADHIATALPGTMYRIWPDYWGGMPSGQLDETAALVGRGIYGANGTRPDWDLLASIDQLKMSLWSVAASPIFYSATLPAPTDRLSLLTNPTALRINAEATGLRQVALQSCPTGSFVALASVVGADFAVAVVNLGNTTSCNSTFVPLSAVGARPSSVTPRIVDVFSDVDMPIRNGGFDVEVAPYAPNSAVLTTGGRLFLITVHADSVQHT